MKSLSSIGVLCLMALASPGQGKKITVTTQSEIVWAGVDRPGDLLLVLATGEIWKYNNQGEPVGSHGFRSLPTLVDPLDGVQAFYYLRDDNLYGNLNADLSDATRHTPDPAFAIAPWLICPSLHELWLLDSADQSIKRTGQRATMVTVESTIKHEAHKSITDYTYMREYQNYLFLLDKSAGILLFNTLGQYIRTLGEKGIESFGFLGEEVYYSKGNKLMLTDLYSDEKRTIPIPVQCRYALVTDNSLYAIGTNNITIIDFRP